MLEDKHILSLKGISASHQGKKILEACNLQVSEHDITCLLGPSGCGKTTLLRTIAGLHSIDHGSIDINGNIISSKQNTIPPEQRQIGMMFQDLALFPHLTVFDNVAYGIRKQNNKNIQSRVHYVLELVDIHSSEFSKYPHELSGGQQQRTALARALAPQPKILLLDEPFSSLDLELREQLATQVRDILKHEKMTALMVTHNQAEAFAMADLIGVMQSGQLLQCDTPFTIYHQPTSKFVADFVGLGNFISAKVISRNSIKTVFGEIQGVIPDEFKLNDEVDLLVRPDDLTLDDKSKISATIEDKRFLGAQFLYTLRLPDQCQLHCYTPSHSSHDIGKPLGVRLDLENLALFRR
ncbi:MAG: ABC transporter ATP-binding protein [Pseudomonadota bacterium]